MKKLSWITALAISLVPLPAAAGGRCGDGILATGEACDDGNTTNGDGCSSACAVEAGFMCRTQPRIAITNGSFESDPFVPGGGWTLASGTVDRVDGSTPGNCLPAGEGAFSIDMNGMSRGQIFQDLPTVAGTRYAITLLGDANCIEAVGDPCSRTCTKRLTITVSDAADATGTAYATSVYDLQGNPTERPWQPLRFEFVARSSTTRFTFTGSDPSFAGPMVDRVAVPASICDPNTCGNATLEAGETCDDGNQTAGDGCSARCLTEPGYTCATTGVACTTTCGDGIVAGAEQCDDGGVTVGDGCSATCTVEPGFACVLDPFTNLSVCMMTCGNGALEAGEACDDGNTVDRDACSNTCLNGPGEPCLVDAQCNLGVCGAAGLHCIGCYDTVGPGMTDYNCTPGGPICDTSGAVPLCVGCVVDADCPTGDVCDVVAHACNAGTRPDAGVDAAMPDAGQDAGARDGGTDAAMGIDAAAVDGGLDASAADAGPRSGGASGGACFCAAHAHARQSAWRITIALVALGGLVRRRRRAVR